MNVDVAAQRFVQTAVRKWFQDRLPSAPEHDDAALRITLARREVERAIRRQLEIEWEDLAALADVVRQAVPPFWRGALIAPLDAVQQAQLRELIVREHVAVAIGLAVGQLHAVLNTPRPIMEPEPAIRPPVHWPWTIHGERLRRESGDAPRTVRREDVAFIGRLVTAHRKAASMSTEDLARRSGVGYGTTRKIERGLNVKLATLARIGGVFGPNFVRMLVEMLTMSTFQRRALTECRRGEVELRKMSTAIDALLT